MAATVVPDGCPLTRRQFVVLGMVMDGRTYQQIADALNVSASVVRTHVVDGYRRLGVRSRAEAISYLGQRGWWGDWSLPADREPPVSVEPPLVLEAPFLAAYLAEFDAGGWPGKTPDVRSKLGMQLALAGHRNRNRRTKGT